jgi:hypothetical protein
MQAAVDSMQVYREAQLQQAATAQPEQQLQHAAQPQPQQQLQGPAIPPHSGHAAPLPTSGAKRPRGEEQSSSDSEDDLDVCLSDCDAEDCSDWEDGRDE